MEYLSFVGIFFSLFHQSCSFQCTVFYLLISNFLNCFCCCYEWDYFISFLKKYLFNWRLIAFQFCGGFCHTLTWISHRGSHVPPPSWTPFPPPSPPYPSRLSQSTGFEYPASCIKPALVIYFTCGNIYVQCFSLKSSHPRLLPQSARVCSLHLCLFCCLEYRIVIIVFLISIYMY